jgi:hypothetical protein
MTRGSRLDAGISKRTRTTEIRVRSLQSSYEALVTFAACGPFAPWATSNST